MRLLFVLVVLANVVLFVWETRVRHPDTDTAHKTLSLPGTIEPIHLLNENKSYGKAALPSAANAVVATDTKPPAPPAVNYRNALPDAAVSLNRVAGCFEAGPFTTQAQASELRELLATHARGISLTTRTASQNDSWWVLIPKAENMEAARARRQMLQERGIKDFWLFNKGELQGAISLGLHETREKAEAAQRQFLDQGIVSELVPRSTRSDTYWLRIPWTGSRLALDEILQTLKMQNADLLIPPLQACQG